MRFRNRSDAGRRLAPRLAQYADRAEVIVLGLPRGGVPVAHEVAHHLRVPLDVFLVRKIGAPYHPELAMGAIAEGGVKVLDQSLIEQLRVPEAAVRDVIRREQMELARRERLYRAGRRLPALKGRTVILVDDGLATGATMEAAIKAVRQHGPARIVVAAPVGAPETCDRLGRLADEVVCAEQPARLEAVGLWYEDFSQTSDEEVHALLAASAPRADPAPPTADPPGSVRPPSRNAPSPSDDAPIAAIRAHAHRTTGDPSDYDEMVDALGRARVVLFGEASHGTHEFYRERALLTQRLIAEKGFNAVAVEADWPDAYRVNRYVRGDRRDVEAVEALGDFERFPAWMWRNADVLDFVGWLRAFNEGRPAAGHAGFYGLDLYSLHASMRAVIRYLEKVDPAAAVRARTRYACFDRFGSQAEAYAHTAGLGLGASCEREVLAQLVDLRRQVVEYVRRDGRLAADESFAAEQNARVVRNAEAYYRTMLGARVASWNLRDRHMHDTLTDLARFLTAAQKQARIVVWAHNSHLGDARSTEMGDHGELNLGQLVRQEFGHDARNVGFTTHVGTVTAAIEWDGPAYRRHVRPSLGGSYERLFHETGVPAFWIDCREAAIATALTPARLERAIGVLYRPETERRSHYFLARLAQQFDYVVHIDETRGVEPLERTSIWEAGEVAETYPSGL